MKIETEDILLSIPTNREGGIQFIWEDNAIITTYNNGKSFYIKANRDGLRSLANHLLSLSQEGVKNHNHFHLDETTGFEEGSFPLIIEKDDSLK